MDFKIYAQKSRAKMQDILLQRLHEKEFFSLTNKYYW